MAVAITRTALSARELRAAAAKVQDAKGPTRTISASLVRVHQRCPSRREDYNHHRPHTSLDGLTPREYHLRSKEDQTLNRANL